MCCFLFTCCECFSKVFGTCLSSRHMCDFILGACLKVWVLHLFSSIGVQPCHAFPLEIMSVVDKLFCYFEYISKNRMSFCLTTSGSFCFFINPWYLIIFIAFDTILSCISVTLYFHQCKAILKTVNIATQVRTIHFNSFWETANVQQDFMMLKLLLASLKSS